MATKFKGLRNQPFLHGAMRWMGIGFEFCFVVGGACWLGHLLDEKEGTSPGWMIIGFFLGFGIMVYNMLRRASTEEKQRQESERRKQQ